MFRPALRGLPQAAAPLTWLRYHPRWMAWPRALDGVPIEYVFHTSRWRPPRDPVAHATDALCQHIDGDASFGDVDVIYAHWLWPGGAVALGLGAHLNRPVAAIARGSEMHAWQQQHPACRAHVARVIRDADAVLANCHALRA